MIRQRELNEGERLIHLRHLDGVYDLTQVATERVAAGRDDLGNASIDGDFSFTGTHSLDEAVRLAVHGWPEGMQRIADIADSIKIDSTILQSAIRIQPTYDVAGEEPDIDRFLQGDPENMVEYSSSIQTHGRVMDFVVNVGQHGGIDKQRIENRGAAILAAVEVLRTSGYSIGVFIVEQCSPSYGLQSDEVMRYEIPILEPGQPINVDTLAFSLMHPSFLRRLLFAANEREDRATRNKFGFRASSGYGVPLPIDGYEHVRPAYKIDKDDGLHMKPKKIVGFAQHLVVSSLAELNPKDS